MRCVLGAEVMPFDHTGKALADAGSRRIDLLACLEHRHFQCVAGSELLALTVAEAELPQPLARLDAALGKVSGFRFR